MTITVRLDGLLLEAPAHLPLPAVGELPTWHVRFASAGDDEICWTGDASDDGGCWARFGHAGTAAVVRLEGILVLRAEVALRRASIERLADGPAELYLLRRAMPYLVHLAGGVALHAACAVVRGETWLFCGDAGCGKSTLALALDATGHAVLADDHVAVTAPEPGEIYAEASFPYADVLPDAVAALRPDVVPTDAKQSVPLRTVRPFRLRVSRLAFLRRGEHEEQTPVAPPEVARRLLMDVIFLGDPASRAEQERRLHVAASLAASLPAFDLVLPDGLDRLRWVHLG